MPDKYRIGGGLQIIENGYFIGPVRGPDAPRKSSSLDISAGLMEPDKGGEESCSIRTPAEQERIYSDLEFDPKVEEFFQLEV